MKSLLPIFIIVLSSSFLIQGCVSAGSSITDNNQAGSTIEIHNPDIGLDAYLKQFPGVRVSGAGQNAKVQMRGESNLELTENPLFVMDGVRLGRDFSRIIRTVDMTLVTELTALHSTKATIFYGHDGYAGVIEISTGSL